MKACDCCRRSDEVIVLMCEEIRDRCTGKVLGMLTRYVCFRCKVRWEVLSKGEAKNGKG